MTTVPARSSRPWDEYRFGDGAEPRLEPGTMGWSVDDLKQPWVRRLWDEGRFEILDGVLTRMPAAKYRGGSVVQNLLFILHPFFAEQNMRAGFAAEVDIAIDAARVIRADAVVVLGDDLRKFEALRFDPPDIDWQDNPLTLPPTLVIESVSRGHELHDRRTKRKWYAEFGVPNYWIVDAYQKSLECLILAGTDYRTDQLGHESEQLTPSAFPGLTIALAAVWG